MKKITILKMLWIVNMVIMLSACGGSNDSSESSNGSSSSSESNPDENTGSSDSDTGVRLKEVTTYDSNNKITEKSIFDYNSKNQLSTQYDYLAVDNNADTGLFLYSESKTEYKGNKIISTGKNFNKNELIIGTSSSITFNIKKDGQYDYSLSKSKEIDENGLEKSSNSMKLTPLSWEKNVERKIKFEETRIDASGTETKRTFYKEWKQIDTYKMEIKEYNEKEELLSPLLTCEYDSKGLMSPEQYTDSPLYRDTTLTGTIMTKCTLPDIPLGFITTIEETNDEGLVTKTKTTYKGAFYYSIYEYIN